MTRLYAALLINAILLAALVLFEIWSGSGMGAELLFKLVATSITMGIFLSFTAIFKMDFNNLASKRLGYIVLALTFGLECLALAGIWEILEINDTFWKVAISGGILIALAFYVLNLKEDLLREVRQKKSDYLD